MMTEINLSYKENGVCIEKIRDFKQGRKIKSIMSLNS